MGTTWAITDDGQITSRRIQLGAHELRYTYGFNCQTALCDLLSRETAKYDTLLVLIDSGARDHAEAILTRIGSVTKVVPLVVETHEPEKSLSLVERILTQAVEAHVDRGSAVVAMGGGVLGNVAGMVAALLYRGLPLIHLPTTPVAAFDAVLSAKQAVNLRHGKNLCGTYLTPSLIACDLAWLRTVPQDLMLAGVAEMAKNVLAVTPHESERFMDATAAGPISSEQALTTLLEIGINAKAPFLAQDPKEQNEAMVFEYGHTVGHALEFASGGLMSHGEAVAWGMLTAADVARQVCGLSDEDWKRHHSLVDQLRLDRTTLSAIDPEAVARLLTMDNKRGYVPTNRDSIAMVLLESLGKPVGPGRTPLISVPRSIVDAAVDTLLSG